MKKIYVKKGWYPAIRWVPNDDIDDRRVQKNIAAVPNRIPFIRPRSVVNVGDSIDIGSLLFVDKNRTQLKFLSPAGGIVKDIRFGFRRRLEAIVIELADNESFVEFDRIDKDGVLEIEPQELTARLINAGLWPFLIELPFCGIADPQRKPPAIWVCLDNSDPFHPSADLYLDENLSYFEMGIAILGRLTDKVCVCRRSSLFVPDYPLNRFITHVVSGGYPADDPGVMVYHTKTSAEENGSWFIDPQNLILMAKSLSCGRFMTDKIVAVSESGNGKSRHVKTRIGAPLSSLRCDKSIAEPSCFIAGGLFSGVRCIDEDFLGPYESSVTLIPKQQDSELLAFARAGFEKLSHSHAFLSTFNKNVLSVDNAFHGENRACINCGYCTRICPVDILPQFTYKCIYADEIEEALQHGLLDCVECGLCSYVCPSKIELTETFSDAKQSLYRERQKESDEIN